MPWKCMEEILKKYQGISFHFSAHLFICYVLYNNYVAEALAKSQDN